MESLGLDFVCICYSLASINTLRWDNAPKGESLTIFWPTDKVPKWESLGLDFVCICYSLASINTLRWDNAPIGESLTIFWPTDKVPKWESLGFDFICICFNLATINTPPVGQCSQGRIINHILAY